MENASGGVTERWQVDFVDQQGNRRHKQFARKKDADAWLGERAKARSPPAPSPPKAAAPPSATPPTLARPSRAENLERSTIDQYQRSVAIIGAASTRHPARPAHQAAGGAAARRSRCRPQPRHGSEGLKHFKGIIDDAQRRGLIASNPATGTTIGRRQAPQAPAHGRSRFPHARRTARHPRPDRQSPRPGLPRRPRRRARYRAARPALVRPRPRTHAVRHHQPARR